MGELSRLNSDYQKIFFKAIVEILAGDFPESILRDRIRGYLTELEQISSRMSKLMGGSKEPKTVTDEYINKFVDKVRDEYDIFYINGRIKIARKGSRLWEIYIGLTKWDHDNSY